MMPPMQRKVPRGSLVADHSSGLDLALGAMSRIAPIRAPRTMPMKKDSSAPGRPSQAAKRAISLASPRPMPSR